MLIGTKRGRGGKVTVVYLIFVFNVDVTGRQVPKIKKKTGVYIDERILSVLC